MNVLIRISVGIDIATCVDEHYTVMAVERRSEQDNGNIARKQNQLYARDRVMKKVSPMSTVYAIVSHTSRNDSICARFDARRVASRPPVATAVAVVTADIPVDFMKT